MFCFPCVLVTVGFSKRLRWRKRTWLVTCIKELVTAACKCTNTHEHQPLMGSMTARGMTHKVTAEAGHYPIQLVPRYGIQVKQGYAN